MPLGSDGGVGPVLIGFAEALAGPEVAMSLLGAGHDVIAFSRGGRHAALRHHRRVHVVEIPAPEEGIAESVDALAALPARFGAEIVLPLDDPSVLLCDQAFGQMRRARPLVVGPTGTQAELAMDKRAQMVAATAAGLAVPPWADMDVGGPVPQGWSFPTMVKPVRAAEIHNGRLRRLGPRHLSSDRELKGLEDDWGAGTEAVVQRRVDGRGAGVFGLAGTQGIHHLSAHRRVRMMNPAGSGSSACSSATVPGALLGPVESFIGNAGWAGMFMIEFLESPDGAMWFMELNGRPWGSMALARRLGLEYPAWAVAERLDPTVIVPAPPTVAPLVCRHLGREVVHMLLVLRGPPAGHSWPGRARTALDLARFGRGQRWYNWCPEEPRMFLCDAWTTVADQVKSR